MIFKISFDPTWDYVPIVIWTELEIAAAFACVSLPAIRVLLVKVVPTHLKSWLSDVTNSPSHGTPREVMPNEGQPGRSWHKDDTWINLDLTEVSGQKQNNG